MPAYVRQLECLSCSNSRNFVHHTEAGQTILSQVEAGALPKTAVVTCGRCGSSSLVRCWGDATPYATTGYVGRRRRRRSSTAVASTESVATEVVTNAQPA